MQGAAAASAEADMSGAGYRQQQAQDEEQQFLEDELRRKLNEGKNYERISKASGSSGQASKHGAKEDRSQQIRGI